LDPRAVHDGAGRRPVREGGRTRAIARRHTRTASPGLGGVTSPFEGMRGRVLAGFVDIQVNGGFGHDFTADPASIWDVARRLPEYGVTAFLPTVTSGPVTTAVEALRVLAAGPPPGWRGA